MSGGKGIGAAVGMIVDAHNHVWLIASDRYPWQPVGGYVPTLEASITDLLNVLDSAGVDRAVLVQPTPYGWENDYLLDAMSSCPERLKAVCLVDPYSIESADKLERLVRKRGASGVRFNWNLDLSHNWIADPVHRRIWSIAQDQGIPVCLQLSWPQLQQAADMADQFPDLRIVIDHFGRPQPGSLEDSTEFLQFLALSKRSNCYAKLSGLYYFSQQTAPFTDTWPLLRATVRAFGASRCLWGSDFPFILDRWSYKDWLDTLGSKFEFSRIELDFILGQTALGLWW
jgi:L-fuconolactonase